MNFDFMHGVVKRSPRSSSHPINSVVQDKPSGFTDPNRDGFYIAPDVRCLDCGASTWFVPYLFGSGWYVSKYCHQCVENSADVETGRASLERVKANLKQRYQNAGLTEFDLSNTERFRPDSRLTNFKETDPNWSAFLLGRAGTGKTTAAIRALRDYVERGWRCRYVVESQMYEVLRPSGGLKIPSLVDLELLIIDEFGSDTRTDWEASMMRQIVNGRYAQRRPTIFVSNYSLRSIAKIQGLGEMVATRIFEGLGGLDVCRAQTGRYIEYNQCFRTGVFTRLPDGAIGLRNKPTETR